MESSRVEFTNTMWAEVKRLATISGTSVAEVIRVAISIFAVHCEAAAAGKKVMIMSASKPFKPEKEVVLPFKVGKPETTPQSTPQSASAEG